MQTVRKGGKNQTKNHEHNISVRFLYVACVKFSDLNLNEHVSCFYIITSRRIPVAPSECPRLSNCSNAKEQREKRLKIEIRDRFYRVLTVEESGRTAATTGVDETVDLKTILEIVIVSHEGLFDYSGKITNYCLYTRRRFFELHAPFRSYVLTRSKLLTDNFNEV